MDNIISNMDIKKIIEQSGCNKPAEEAQIKLCNTKLKQNNLPELPEDFVKVLLQANGITSDDVNIFGALEENNWFYDVCEYNIKNQKTPSTKLVLGFDDDTRLIYESSSKLYLVVSDFGTDMKSYNLIEALEYFLRIQ